MTLEQKSPLLFGFDRSATPRFNGDPLDWLEEHFAIPFSARAKRFSRSQGPHITDIIRAANDLRHRKVVVRMCTGGGKTTLLEATAIFSVGADPGPMLIVGQTDKDTKDWSESRLQPCLEACEPTARIMAAMDRHELRNMEFLFPAGNLFLTGPNLSGLQAKSMQKCYGDETWIWPRGMIGELKARHHDRWNRKTILVSQGWESDSDTPHDMDAEYVEGDDNRRGFDCPHCHRWQEYTWDAVKYEEKLIPGTQRIDYDATAKTARIVCKFPECGQVATRDTPAERRALATRASYRPFNPHHMDGVTSFMCPAWAVWWIPLGTLVVEWLKAQAAKHRGDKELLKKFTMKRAAAVWENKSARVTDDAVTSMRCSDTKLKESPIDPVLVTMCADVGELRTHWSIQVWTAAGESWVIDHGTCLAPEDLIGLAKTLEYPIRGTAKTCRPMCGLIDSGDFTERIYRVCAMSGGIFSPSKGSGAQSGSWRSGEVKEYPALVLYTYVDYQAKVALYIDRIAKKGSPRLRFAHDLSEEFLLGHMGQRIIESEDRKGKVWKKVAGDHYGDCSKLHVVSWWALKQYFETT